MIRVCTLILSMTLCSLSLVFGGNPDRQGESGAVELLMNPWARSAGLHTMNTSFIGGVEALRLNVAGLARINKTEFIVGHTRYFNGTDTKINSVGFAQKMGKNNFIGVSLMAIDFGELPVTTTAQPEGTGATFSPNFFNLGVGFSHIFENKITVGFLVRLINESITNASAFGFGLDAGVQYVAGERDNFKFGISLRNIGTRMSFKGEGLSFTTISPDGNEIRADVQSDDFELPSTLNIGASYDLYFPGKNRVTLFGNFTSNAFSRDQAGGGLEYSFNDLFMLRGAYRFDIDEDEFQKNIYDGLSFGATLQVPFAKGSLSKLAFDYGYRATDTFDGTHNFSMRINI